jgi:hypothetical protein
MHIFSYEKTSTCEKCSKRFKNSRNRRTQKWCQDCNKARNIPTARQNKQHGSSPEAFLSYKHSNLRSLVRRKKKRIDFDIKVHELSEMYHAQKGKCKLTGHPMTHDAIRRPYSNISIDRIDPNGGYTKSNVRLVWKILNLLRNEFSDDVVWQFVEQAYEGMRKNREAVR